jgi:hypothetical protein
MKTEWWYDDATFHYSGETELCLAQLTVNDDGSAQIILLGERREFVSEDDASIWLVDEEYRHLDDLIADLRESGVPIDPRIKPPAATVPEDQMVIKLKPAPETPGGAKPLFVDQVDSVVEFVDPPPGRPLTP